MRRLVVLANSRKPSGRCVAGRVIEPSSCAGWIRPVSDRPGEEVSFHERSYADGEDPRLLDIVDVPLLEPRPRMPQTENHLLDPTLYWEKVGGFARSDLLQLCDSASVLWFNGVSSSKGLNDEVPVAEAAKLTSSLFLVQPRNLVLQVVQGMYKRQVRARFEWSAIEYNFVVTDPLVEAAVLPGGLGVRPYGRPAVACVSLAEPLGSFHYKLIASIIDL